MAFNRLAKGPADAPADLFASAPRDIFAGLVSSLVAVAYGLSFAALIFAPPLTPWIAYGIVATFVTLAVSTAIVALRSSLPFAIAGPDPTVPVQATLVAALVARLSEAGAPGDLIGPVMIVMGLAAALTGLLLCGLGLARAGSAIRFIPYPVIGGFLGATGWLMVSGAVGVVTGYGLGLSTIDALLAAPVLAQLAPAVAVALAIYLAIRRFGEHPFVLPVILLAGIAAAHLAFALSGTSLAEAELQGWLFKAPAAFSLTPTWHLEALKMFPWQVLAPLAGDIVAVMFVIAICSLLNTTGLEFVTEREVDLSRELNTIGIANLASAALGGYGSTIALNRTTLNYVAGARGRLSGLTVAAVSALVLIADPGFIAYVPKFVLGGILLYLGAIFIYEWLIDSARRISLLEYASLLAIAVLILQFGFLAGVLIGVVIGCATFAVSASRVDAVKFSFDGSEYRSSLDRGPEALKILAKHGGEIQGMSLQSYLFFGSANRLYEKVKALFARQPGIRFLIFDFRLVTGIDSSAMHSFAQIKRAANKEGAQTCARQSGAGAARRASQAPAHRTGCPPRGRSRSDARNVRGRRHCRSRRRRRRCAGFAAMVRAGTRQCRLRRGTRRALRAIGGSQGRDHRLARRCRRLYAFHRRRPRRHHRQTRRRTLDAGAEPRPARDHGRDGAHHRPSAERHHSGGGR